LKIAEHDGRIVKTMGDGLLLEFPSVVNAIQCSLEVQQGMAERNEGTDDAQRIIFRIGVNLGDLIIEGEDIFGDGVNIAARLQEISEQGGICVSGAVFEQMSGRTDHKFDDLGYRKLKNITQPVRIYQVRFTETHSDGETRAGFGTRKRQPVASGGCLCGSVRHEIWAEPLGAGYCHYKFCKLVD
jgi:class 3 adenylate cyclase